MKASVALSQARRRADLSQSELALRTGLKQPAISRIESGKVVPGVDTLDRLLRACGEGLEPVRRLGAGVDRTVIRQLLRLSPGQRLRKATQEARTLERLRSFARKA